MAEWFTKSETDAINMLKRDHDKVEDLFKRFEKAESPEERRTVIVQALRELKVHSQIEEEIFYPTVWRSVGESTMDEAAEEHHVAKVLIAEIEKLVNAPSERLDAKFHVLAENIRAHVKEEERDMLPKARKMDIDFEQLGRQMLQRKQMLETGGVPSSPEEKMVNAAGLTSLPGPR